MMVVRTLLVACVASLALAPAASAHGRGFIDDALEGLRSGDPVFVHPAAVPTLRPAEIAGLRDRVVLSRRTIYVAILPADAAHELGSPVNVLRAVRDGIGLDGTYAVVVGGIFGAVSGRGEPGRDRAAHDAQAALQANGARGLPAVLTDFVERTAASGETGDGGSSRWPILAGAAAALGLGSLALLATLARARRRSSVG